MPRIDTAQIKEILAGMIPPLLEARESAALGVTKLQLQNAAISVEETFKSLGEKPPGIPEMYRMRSALLQAADLIAGALQDDDGFDQHAREQLRQVITKIGKIDSMLATYRLMVRPPSVDDPKPDKRAQIVISVHESGKPSVEIEYFGNKGWRVGTVRYVHFEDALDVARLEDKKSLPQSAARWISVSAELYQQLLFVSNGGDPSVNAEALIHQGLRSLGDRAQDAE